MINIGVDSSGPSLAEIFARKRRDLVEKLEHQREKSRVEEKDRPKTKEELAQIRKEMMKAKHTKSKSELGVKVLEPHNPHTDRSKSPFTKGVAFNFFEGEKKPKKEPNPEVLERLAMGIKPKVYLRYYLVTHRSKRRK